MGPTHRAATAAAVLLLVCQLAPGAAAANTDPAGSCVADATTLCLQNNRFQLQVSWEDFDMNTGAGSVGTAFLTGDTGYFWFVDPELPELYVKVLDGTLVNGNYWVFFASLTNWEYTLTVTDLDTGAAQEYTNPLGSFTTVTDIEAFPDSPAPPPATLAEPAAGFPISEIAVDADTLGLATRGTASGACEPSDTRLCLDNRRFQVDVEWVSPTDSGPGQVIPLTDQAAFFWFFEPNSVELAVKIVDGGSQNGNFWLFYGALTNVEYQITVTDSCTGAVQSYFNPQGMLTSTGDFAAFPSTPNCNLFLDGFESGDTSAWSGVVGE
jgi:hypothetical protein